MLKEKEQQDQPGAGFSIRLSMENVTFWATSGGKRMSHPEALTEIPWLPLVLSLVPAGMDPPGRVGEEGFGHTRGRVWGSHRAPFPCLLQGLILPGKARGCRSSLQSRHHPQLCLGPSEAFPAGKDKGRCHGMFSAREGLECCPQGQVCSKICLALPRATSPGVQGP